MNKRIIALFLVLLVAAFLRLYRLEAFTEFLGDQGRTGIIIWNAWNNKIFPLVGPPVLSGQYLGPFFYYFMAFPFILSHFNPLGPALWMAMLGILNVFLIFFLGKKLFGYWIGLALAVLYTVSPYIISSDRTLWEPNLIPFFVFLYIFLIYTIYQRRLFLAFFPLGVVVGILVQLHYPNVFFIILSLFFLLFLLLTKKKQETLSEILFPSFLALVGFLLVLSPFLYYEYNHGWKDLKEILLIVSPSGSVLGKRVFLYSLFDFSSRLFYTMFPIARSQIMMIITLVVVGTAFIRKNFWGFFFGAWFVFGLVAISLYKGIVFDHYLNFLLPLPFFLFGMVMYISKKYVPSFFWIALVVLIAVFQLRNSDMWAEGPNDIFRTKSFVLEMIRRASGEPFSFTLISSRSFSDLHYRYFFATGDIHPASIVSTSYKNLFLICEKGPCRSVKEMEKMRSVRAICYEDHCSGEYPTIDLGEWQLVTIYDVLGSRMYVYRRKPLLRS